MRSTVVVPLVLLANADHNGIRHLARAAPRVAGGARLQLDCVRPIRGPLALFPLVRIVEQDIKWD